MNLLLVRHAIAEDREVFARTGKSDRRRPLTERGRKKMRKNLKGIKVIAPKIDLLASSPFTRAKQTSDLFSEFYDGIEASLVKALEPNSNCDTFVDWLKTKKNLDTVVAVGHEPHLSLLALFLIPSFVSNSVPGRTSIKETTPFSIRKGGACLIEFGDRIERGRGKLGCLIQPSQLRRVGGLKLSC